MFGQNHFWREKGLLRHISIVLKSEETLNDISIRRVNNGTKCPVIKQYVWAKPIFDRTLLTGRPLFQAQLTALVRLTPGGYPGKERLMSSIIFLLTV